MAEFTIVGGGLAGCTLAWALHKRGRAVKIVDRGDLVTSTKVAAGIVNPITGPYLTKGSRFEELWPAALKFYRSIEAKSGKSLFRQMSLLRLLHSQDQVKKWARRLKTPGYTECLVEGPLKVSDQFCSEFGGFVINRAGHLDTVAFIDATKNVMGEQWFNGEVLEPEPEGITIFCEGASGARNPLFDWVNFKPVKGEILTIKIRGLKEDRIVNRGNLWLLPIGGSRFRAGATYDWDSNDCVTTVVGRDQIEERLRQLVRVPFEVEDHQAAVRPVIGSRKLLMGLHPAHDRIGFFNGLGSKGVLVAPFFAENFAAHLCGESTIDHEVNLRGNF